MKPAREPASSRPKPCASLKKPHESCTFAAPCGPRRKKKDRGQTSAFPSETSRLKPVILAHRVEPSPGSSTIELPPAFAESGTYPPDRALPVLPASRVPPHLPKGTKLGLGRGAHLGTPSSVNHIATATQTTGRIAKAASCLHLLRASPALHPPERPSHTHTYPETRFRRERAPIFIYCTQTSLLLRVMVVIVAATTRR